MAVTKIGYQQWHSSLTDKTFDSREAAAHYDEIAARTAHAATQQESELDNLTAEQVKLVAQAMISATADHGRQTSIDDDASVFLTMHPEYVNNSANGGKMKAALIAKGRLQYATVHDLNEVYSELREAGTLELNQKVLDEQNRQDVLARAKELSQPFDEQEAYNLPMHELKRRANGNYL